MYQGSNLPSLKWVEMSALESVMLVHQIEEIVDVIQDPFFFREHISEHIVKYNVVFPFFLSWV